jgi:hypothetical protein
VICGEIVEVLSNPLGNIKSTAHYIGEPAEIVAIINDGASLVRFSDGHQMTVENDKIKSFKDKTMAIKREIGDRIIIADGRDYVPPSARVIASTFKEAAEDEKSIYISQGKLGISISIESLRRILKWAEDGE